jgi:hypothetical protein
VRRGSRSPGLKSARMARLLWFLARRPQRPNQRTNGIVWGSRMALIRVKYVNAFIDRHGKARHYFRRPGFKQVPLPGLPGSVEFNAAYEAALSGEVAPRVEIGAGRAKPGTIAVAVAGYFSSLDFGGLADETRRSRRSILERFRAERDAVRPPLFAPELHRLVQGCVPCGRLARGRLGAWSPQGGTTPRGRGRPRRERHCRYLWAFQPERGCP